MSLLCYNMCMDTRTWEVYTLTDPRTQQVRYIGITFRKKARFREHLSRAVTGGKTHRDCWIRSLIAQSLRPMYAVIEQGHGSGWQEAERRWIAYYRPQTHLVNLTDGGDGCPGYIPTPELRQMWSTMRAGVPYRPGRISAMKGKKHTPEAIEKIRVASKNRRASVATRLQMSNAAKARGIPAEQRAKMHAASRQTRQTDAYRQKAVIAHPGKQILCIETGQTFSSIRATARALNVTKGAIQFAIRRAMPCKGFTLKLL
jgi:hypothetical protein